MWPVQEKFDIPPSDTLFSTFNGEFMAWWIWVIAGLALFALEMASPGIFVALFFGIGAIIVGIITATGIITESSHQWLSFSVISIGSLLILRKYFSSLGADSKEQDELIGEFATASIHIIAGSVGSAELRGTTWKARNIGSTEVKPGDRCIVRGRSGLQIEIEKHT